MNKVVLYTRSYDMSYKLKNALKLQYELYFTTEGLDNISLLYQQKPDVIIIDADFIKENYSVINYVISSQKWPVIVVTNQIETGMFYNFINDPFFYLLNQSDILSLRVLIPSLLKSTKIINTYKNQISDLKAYKEEERMIKKAKLHLMDKGMSESEAHSQIIHLAMTKRISKLEAAKIILSD